jgi:hypothetical protein
MESTCLVCEPNGSSWFGAGIGHVSVIDCSTERSYSYRLWLITSRGSDEFEAKWCGCFAFDRVKFDTFDGD